MKSIINNNFLTLNPMNLFMTAFWSPFKINISLMTQRCAYAFKLYYFNIEPTLNSMSINLSKEYFFNI